MRIYVTIDTGKVGPSTQTLDVALRRLLPAQTLSDLSLGLYGNFVRLSLMRFPLWAITCFPSSP